MRQDERTNIMTEVARVTGPDAANGNDGLAPAPCIQLGSFQCAENDEEDLLAWYAQRRTPAMRTLPGCVMLAATGTPA